jgi:predicted RNA-binding Zn-ribbon protein involved in translation (DUF1610 family)
MQCPDCGTLMNRHAEKPLQRLPGDSLLFDSGHHEVIAIIHCCPACGKIELTVEPLARPLR